METRARRPDEVTTRMTAFQGPDEDDVPWIRVVVRGSPRLLWSSPDDGGQSSAAPPEQPDPPR